MTMKNICKCLKTDSEIINSVKETNKTLATGKWHFMKLQHSKRSSKIENYFHYCFSLDILHCGPILNNANETNYHFWKRLRIRLTPKVIFLKVHFLNNVILSYTCSFKSWFFFSSFASVIDVENIIRNNSKGRSI